MTQLTLFDAPAPDVPPAPPQQVKSNAIGNLCLWMFGRGPDGVTCGDCELLGRHLPGSELEGELKCFLLYRVAHQADWPACVRFRRLP